MINTDDFSMDYPGEVINIDDPIKERLRKMGQGDVEGVVQPPVINR